MSTRRRSNLEPLNPNMKSTNENNTKRPSRRVSMAATSTSVTDKTNRRSNQDTFDSVMKHPNDNNFKRPSRRASMAIPKTSATIRYGVFAAPPSKAIKEVKEKSKGSHSRSLVDNRVENRRRSNLKAATKGGINNGTIVKSTTISDVIKETDEPFMSAESFDFNQTIQSPYIGSPSMAGPLTRSRRARRTSVYVKPSTSTVLVKQNKPDDLRDATRQNVRASEQRPFDTPKQTKQSEKNKNTLRSKELKLNVNEIIEYNLDNDTGSSTSRLENKIQLVTPMTRKRLQRLSAMVPSSSCSNQIEKVAPYTPQPPSDPTNVLKKKMKVKLESKIEEKVAKLPPSTPYELVTNSTENGSPIEMFVEINERPSRPTAAKYVTETPFPLTNRNSKHEKLPVKNLDSEEIVTKAQKIVQKGNSITPKSSNAYAKRHNIENSLKNLAMNEPSQKICGRSQSRRENKENDCGSESAPSPQLVTGDLYKGCSVM